MVTHFGHALRLAWARNFIALAVGAAALMPPAAQAELRYWTFIGGCSGADWFGMLSGTNSQGKTTCWSNLPVGLSGSSVPGEFDDVFINAVSPPSDLLVDFAAPARGTGSSAYVRSLTLAGSSSFAAGLRMERGFLSLQSLTVGVASGNRLGRFEQTLASVSVSGRMDVARGEYRQVDGLLSAHEVAVGAGAGENGFISITGARPEFLVPTLIVGGAGEGHLELNADNVDVTRGMDTRNVSIGENAGGSGKVTVLGSYWANGDGQVTVGGAGKGVVEISGGSVVNFGFGNVVLGRDAGSSGTLSLSGSGASTLGGLDAVVGSAGYGLLEVNGGTRFSGGDVHLGKFTEGLGEVRVEGSPTAGVAEFVVASLDVGQAGRGTLRIGPQGSVRVVSLLSIGARGRVELEGGVLDLTAFRFGQADRFDWRSGVLSFSSPVAMDGVSLPTLLELGAGQELRVASTLTVADGGHLKLAGGTLETTVLQLNGTGQFTASGVHHLVIGSSRDSRITASGALTLSNGVFSTGFDFHGVLEVGSETVTLLDSGWADLGSLTRLGQGGRLVSPSGVRLGALDAIQSLGDARIDAKVNNGGEIFANGGTLTFGRDVSGNGQIVGDVVFEAVLSSGADPIDMSFGRGDVTFAETSTLVLRIESSSQREGFDKLLEMDLLSFQGVLKLEFATGFHAVAGERFQLLGFQSFDGTLDEGNVRVTGLDAGRVDLSRLAIDGTIAVAPVPEPGTMALCLGGLGLLGARAWRRGSRPGSIANGITS